MSETQYPIATICGSMRYYKRMLEFAALLTADGWIVLMPFITSYIGDKPADITKIMLDDMHKTKISMSEKVFVVGHHIGKSTASEIAYAEEKGIPVKRVGWITD